MSQNKTEINVKSAWRREIKGECERGMLKEIQKRAANLQKRSWLGLHQSLSPAVFDLLEADQMHQSRL